jgi:hypothetical protein
VVLYEQPEAALRSARVRALSGDPADQLAVAQHGGSARALPATIDRLDRDPRIVHIRLVDESHRTHYSSNASRHARRDYQAHSSVAHLLEHGTAGRANPFAQNRAGGSRGRER